MLWDCDLDPQRSKVILPKGHNFSPRIAGVTHKTEEYPNAWNFQDLNPDLPESGIDLSRKTLWFMDDLQFLCKRYDLSKEYVSDEIVDLTNIPEDKQEIYKKTSRTFYFRTFVPKYVDEDVEVVSSESDLDDLEEEDFELDSTQMGLLDSTLDFEEEDDKMNKIIAFFAKMPKVTGLVQGMVDMMQSLARILPLVIVKLDDDNLKGSLKRTVDIINLGLEKVLKLCAYLGIKVQKKPNGAIGEIVKNRFKKDKKDFLEYEIDELNKSLDSLENVDEEDDEDEDEEQIPQKGAVPVVVKQNHMYPQKMPIGGAKPGEPSIIVVDNSNATLETVGAPIPPKPPKPPPTKVFWSTVDNQKMDERKPQAAPTKP